MCFKIFVRDGGKRIMIFYATNYAQKLLGYAGQEGFED
jgi:hypothetical protein